MHVWTAGGGGGEARRDVGYWCMCELQEEEEKRTEAMLSYKAWEESKKEKLAKEKARQRREEELKKEKERQEREDKRVEAEVVRALFKILEHFWASVRGCDGRCTVGLACLASYNLSCL